MPLGESEAYDEYVEEEPETRLRWATVWVAITILLILAWTGFYGWANYQQMLLGGTLQQWTAWVTAWAVPVLLITSAWLVIMRNSSREAERFGVIASTLSAEAAILEERLTTVNRELSLAREFLGSQSRELDSLGRIATERLSEHAGALQTLIQTNGAQVDSIASVSTTALENMGKLRDDLPVIANSAKDVSNQIGTAGMTAHTHIAELVSGFERLNDFGKASENQVDSIQAKIDVVLSVFESRIIELEELVEHRFSSLADKSEALRTDLDSREVEALAAMRRRAQVLQDEFSETRETLEQEEAEGLRSLRARLTTLREEAVTISASIHDSEDGALNIWQERIVTLKSQLTAAIAEVQTIDEKALEFANRKLSALRVEAENVDARLAARDADLAEQLDLRMAALKENEVIALKSLTEQFALFDASLAAHREAQLSETEVLAERSEAIALKINSLTSVFAEASAIGQTAQTTIAENADIIAAKLADSRQSIEGTDNSVKELTEACVRLLELIQASAQHSQTDLPEALGIAEARLTEVQNTAESLYGVVADAAAKGEDLSSYLIEAKLTERETIADIDGLHTRVAASQSSTHETIAHLQSDLTQLTDQSELLSQTAQGQLREAIASLEEAAKSAPETLESGLRDSISSIAESLAEKTKQSLSKSLRDATEDSVGQLEASVARTSSLSRETTINLRDQLAKVDELAGNLENRVSRAREHAEEQINNDFARRMALLTDSLNSNAIDIAKAMSSDVSDTAWASYLKGDRGIFTRRAVRLLDNTEARDIAEIYDDDLQFRENVSRYIHDFEAMLRSMLSTRDGNALGVTILSSDMGKLYVALAQAIERLRD